MTLLARLDLCGIAVAATLLLSCGADSIDSASLQADSPVSSQLLPGAATDGYFYPQFQRWRIARVRAVPGATVPVDLRGIPRILLGRPVYFGPGYMTVPFLNGPAEILLPACFTTSPKQLVVAAVDGRARNKAVPLNLDAAPDGHLTYVMDSMFEVSIEPNPQLDDAGYLQRRYAAHFNARLAHELARGAKPACAIQPVKLPAPHNRDLVLRSSETGKEIVLPGAELDPETPLTTLNASYDQRRMLDPQDPASTVYGCQGKVEIDRLMGQETEQYPPKTEHLIVRGLVGVTSDGEMCDRFTMIRRIDPQALLDLYSLKLPERMPGLAMPVSMRLAKWIGEGAFRAEVGPAEFELSGIDQVRILVTLVKAPPGPAPATAVKPTPLRARELPVETVAKPAAEAVPPSRIRRWTDESGVVSYGDASAAPPAMERQ